MLELVHRRHGDGIEVTARTRKDHANLFFHLQRRELRLFQELSQARTAREHLLGGSVEVGSELRKGRHFAVLRQLAFDLSGHLLHRLGLRRGADARHRETDVHGRADTLIEKVGLEEDLAVSDRDDVRGNIGGHVVSLRLDDGQRGK